MPSKNLHYTKEQQAAVDRLHLLLAEQGVDLKDQRGIPSDSALFRYLVDEELKRHASPQNSVCKA